MQGVSGYRLLVSNASAALIGRLAAIALGVALATILFKALGAQRYGEWSLLTLLAGYSTLMDFGLSSAVERRVAALVSIGSDALIPATINTSLTVLLALIAAGELVVWAVLATPSTASLEPATRRALLVLPLCSGLTLAALSTGAVLAGQQRIALLYLWRTAGLAAGTAAVIVAVRLGITALDTLLFLYTAGSIVTFALVWRSIGQSVPRLHLGLVWDRSALRELFWFGGVVQFATMLPPLAEYAFRLIVGARFGLALTGVYDLGARAAMVPRSLAGALFAAMVPFAVQAEQRGGPQALRELVRVTVRHVALFILPASALLIAFSKPLVDIWLSNAAQSDQVRRCFEILLVAHAVGAIAVPAAMVGRALARPMPEAVCTAIAFAAALVVAKLAPSFEIATMALWGIPAVGGFVAWVWLDRLRKVGAINIVDAASTLLVAALTLLVARALLPMDQGLLTVLGRLAASALFAVAAAAAVEFRHRRWRATGMSLLQRYSR